jgi:hypothetical protein
VNRVEGQKRGRPTIPDAELFSDRIHLFGLFDVNWADLGWELENLRNANDVPTALKILAPEDRQYAIRLLLSPIETATIDKPGEMARELSRRFRTLLKNVESMEKSITETEKYAQSLTRMLSQEMAVPERNIVISEKNNADEGLNQDKNRLTVLLAEKNSIAQQLKNARVNFARSELVKFCESDRSRLNPRRTANALAGLPFMSWRQSAMRCVKVETDRAPGGFHYQTFRLVGRIIKAWDRKLTSQGVDADELVDADALVRHARQYLEANRKTPARVFSGLWDNFRYLRLSIEQVMKEGLQPGERAYRITSEYFRRSGAPRSESEAFWAKKESIQRGKIRVRK